MKRIALISDTHSYCGEDVIKYLKDCDELWHAGDIGSFETLEHYEKICPVFRGVYGNIDNHKIRAALPEVLDFELEGVRVGILHIGGYPGRYYPQARALLQKSAIDLFISGHSHITKVIRDKKNDLIHMNPGSCGHHGFHIIRTLLRFTLDAGEIKQVEVIELGKRGAIN